MTNCPSIVTIAFNHHYDGRFIPWRNLVLRLYFTAADCDAGHNDSGHSGQGHDKLRANAEIGPFHFSGSLDCAFGS